MSGAIVFITHFKVKEGKLDAFRRHYRESIPITMADKPDTQAQLAYGNEDATEVSIVRLFPNADALDLQIQGADERSKRTYEYIEPTGIEIFGTPNPATVEKMKKITGSSIKLRISPHFIDGFIR
jgi:hypothetical protein